MQQKITIYGQQFTSYHQRVLEVSSETGALLAVGLACAELNSRRRERGEGRGEREEGKERGRAGRRRWEGGREGKEGEEGQWEEERERNRGSTEVVIYGQGGKKREGIGGGKRERDSQNKSLL